MSNKKVLPKRYDKILLDRKIVVRRGKVIMKTVKEKVIAENVSLSIEDVDTLNEWAYTTANTQGIFYKRSKSINWGKLNPFKSK